MHRVSLALRNGLWNSLGTVVTSTVGLALSVVVVRTIQDEFTYGQLSYYLWLAGLVTTIGILGVPQALTRFTAALRGEDRLDAAASLGRWSLRQLVAINLIASLAILLWALLSSPPIRGYLLVTALLPAFNAWGRILASRFSGREHYRPNTIATIVAAVTQLLLVVLAYLLGWGVFGYFIALVSPNIVVALVLAGFARGSGGQLPALRLPRPEWALVRAFLVFTLPTTLGMFLDAVVWQRSEVFFLERFSSFEEVGFYSLAFTLASMIMGLGWALINGFLPAIAHDHGAGQIEAIHSKIGQAMVLSFAFAVPFAFGGLASVHEILLYIFGETWLPVAPSARILFIGLVPGVISGVFGLTTSAINRPWALLPLMGTITALNLVLDVLLIPGLGAVGAALANTIAQVSFAIVAWFIIRRLVSLTLPWGPLLTIVLIGVATTYAVPAILLPLLPGALGLIITVAVSGIAYLLAILIVSTRLPGLEALGERFPLLNRLLPKSHR